MKKILLLLMLCPVMLVAQNAFHDLTATTIDGKTFHFSSLKGKKVMIVNTASECGYTRQYADLQQLHSTYKDSGLVILGFPSNDFGKQEPGSDAEISEFCKKNFGVDFQLFQKSAVSGPSMNAVYQWLTEKQRNGKMDSSVKWNFQKYLVNENGELVEVLYSNTKPTDDKVIAWLRKK